MDKSGCGTYKYPSKARYEGEWQANTKEGSGIYYYPKGGLYKVHPTSSRSRSSPSNLSADELPTCCASWVTLSSS